MSIIGQNILAGASGQGGTYTIDQSVRVNKASSAFMDLTWDPSGDLQSWTFSAWVKRGATGNSGMSFKVFGAWNSGTMLSDMNFDNDNITCSEYVSSTTVGRLTTNAKYADAAAWYHLVFVWDSDNVTSADRYRLYVNGNRVTDFSSETQPGSGQASATNYVGSARLFKQNTDEYYDGYCAEVYFIDGQSLTADTFGETNALTGQWVPKSDAVVKAAVTFGDNGFLTQFGDASSLGLDTSGEGNNFTTLSGFSASDQVLDSPTNNFCTFEPGIKPTNRGGQTISEGNLQIDVGADYTACAGTQPLPSTGKWYWEFYSTAFTTCEIGIVATNSNRWMSSDGSPQGGDSQILYSSDGQKNIDASYSAYGDSYANNQIIGIAVNMDDSEITFYNEGVSQGAISFSGGITSTRSGVLIVPAFEIYSFTCQVNFGQDGTFCGQKVAQGNSDANSIGNFFYTVPANYLALCTSNLPEPTIIKGGEHMNSLIWSGNDATGRAMTGLGFKPDMVWLKQRNGTEQYNEYDSIRGATKFLATNDNTVEGTLAQGVTAFDSDGWTMGSDTANNGSGKTYVGWNWKGDGVAGGTANTDGTIDTVVNVNSAAGFSIVGFTGTAANGTFGHGLSVAPDLVVVKNRETATGWILGADVAYMQNDRNYYMQWNSNAAAATSTGLWNSIAPTATTVSIGGDTDVNGSGNDIIAYCWHSVEGYSRFAQFIGNGNADGTFIYTGFRPQYVYIKRMNATPEWYLSDDARNPYNIVDGLLLLEGTNAEQTPFPLWNYVSNGIKLKSSDGAFNGNGDPNLVVAFAESPFKYSNAH